MHDGFHPEQSFHVTLERSMDIFMEFYLFPTIHHRPPTVSHSLSTTYYKPHTSATNYRQLRDHQGSFWGPSGITKDHSGGICRVIMDDQGSFWGQAGITKDHFWEQSGIIKDHLRANQGSPTIILGAREVVQGCFVVQIWDFKGSTL